MALCPKESASVSLDLPIHRRPAAAVLAAVLVMSSLLFGTSSVVRAVTTVWINEIHYDNDGTDTGEAIEVAGPAGTDLTGWSLVLYNGSGGALYTTTALSGVIADQLSGFGTSFVSYPTNGIQNGAPDGVALVDAAGSVVQFLSYEGSFTAVGGPADGMTSTDIGVAESSSTPVGHSLQLSGAGTTYEDFTWAAPQASTFGAPNAGQTFGTVTNHPVVASCGSQLNVLEGMAASQEVTASDADGTVTSIGIDGIAPSDPGTITIGATTPASGPGEAASATVDVAAGTPVGTYTVTVSASSEDVSPGTCELVVSIQPILSIGQVQGQTLDTEGGRSDVSPLDGQTVFVRGVVTQRIRQATSSGGTNYSFFLQDSLSRADGDPLTSDGILVFIGRFTSLLRYEASGTYFPEVGDEIVLQARVGEFFNMTQLSSARFVSELVDRGDLATTVEIADAMPPDDLADAYRYWERHEGMLVSVPAGAEVVAGRDVFASTHDGEVWVIRGDHPLAQRADPYARRVFRDVHPLDDIGPLGSFDNGNGMRILLVSHGLKWVERSNETLIAPARTFDTVENAVGGGVFFSFGKYGIEVGEQLELTPGVDPSLNAPPAPHDEAVEYATAPYNVENLYDFRDDPHDGCDFVGNAGCPGVSPPFNYVPASEADYRAQLTALAEQIVHDLHAPEILLIQEAEDQDICAVVGGTLDCEGGVDDRDGRPDTLQELALAIGAAGGPAYDAAYDRDGADDRGIVSGFLYRTDRVELLAADAGHAVLGDSPQVAYSAPGLDYNADVQNPKALNAELPAGVEEGDECDEPVACVFTRDPQVGLFRIWRDAIGASAFTDVYAISNHFSSGPDRRVEQRTEQAAYNAAIVRALTDADPDARIVVGGDFNVYPEPDDPFTPNESDQLAALYELGLHSLWEDVLAVAPSSAYSYIFEGQAQTLDNQFVNDALYRELNAVRFAHVNADWPAAHEDDGSRGASDHDPQVARFDAVTADALANLVEHLLADGSIDESKADQLLDRLARVAGHIEAGRMSAAKAQLRAFANQVDGLSPRWIEPDVAELLRLESEVLASTL